MSHPYPENSTPKAEHGTNPVSAILKYVPIVVILVVAFILWQDYQRRSASEASFANLQMENNMRMNIRNHITEFIRASASNFQASMLGGISGLQVTVTNTTQYMMDDVVVEVSYIKVDGDVYKKEYLNFPYLGPSQYMTVKAPDSPRGIRVTYQIIRISSKALGM